MGKNHWWHVSYAGATVLLALVAWLGWRPTAVHLWVAWATLAVLAIIYFSVGRLAFDDKRYALPYMLVLIVGCGVATACSPSLASIQGIAFPLIWCFSTTFRRALVMNVLLALSVCIGFIATLGFEPDAVMQSVVIECLSLTFSISLGVWFSRVADESNRRQELLDELHSTQDRLAALSRDAGVTSERERLAREIHDTIAQSLTGLVLLAQRAQGELATGPERREALADQLALLESSAREALSETRSLVASTASNTLSERGLVPALERLAERFTRETDIAVSVQATGNAIGDRDTEVVLLRCAQEGLANVRKHSGAGTASVTLAVEGAAARLTVTDDGAGFDPTADSSGFGLAGLRDRLALVDGTLSVTSVDGRGSVLTATLPVTATITVAEPGPTPPVPDDSKNRAAAPVGIEAAAPFDPSRRSQSDLLRERTP